MDEHELRESLRRLPEVRPGAELTAEVLARVERYERQRAIAAAGAGNPGGGARWRPALLAAGLAAGLVAAAGLWQPGGGRWLDAGGGEAAAPAGARAERLDGEPGEAGGGAAAGGERATGEAVDRGAPPTGGGRAPAGVDAAAAARPAAVAAPGEADRPPRTGAGSPRGPTTREAPGGERGSAAAGSVGDPRLAIASPAAGGAQAAGGAAADRDPVAPPAAETVAALPGADFFAAPPSGRPPAAAADPAAVAPAARLARLRAERDSLERRLVAFRSELPPAEPPVVLLGADEGLELVFDLGRSAAGTPPAGTAGGARPAVHSTPGPPRRF